MAWGDHASSPSASSCCSPAVTGARRGARNGALLVEPPGQGEVLHRTVNETAGRFAGLLGPCGGPHRHGAVGSASVGDARCNGHGDTPCVPKRARPGDIWYTFVQTTRAVRAHGMLTEPRVRSIPARTSACGALFFLRLWHPSSSVPPAFV